MSGIVEAILWLAVISGALYGLHRLTLPPSRRTKPQEQSRFGTALGSAMVDLHALLNPEARHVVEIRREQRKEQDGSGEPPGPDSDEHGSHNNSRS